MKLTCSIHKMHDQLLHTSTPHTQNTTCACHVYISVRVRLQKITSLCVGAGHCKPYKKKGNAFAPSRLDRPDCGSWCDAGRSRHAARRLHVPATPRVQQTYTTHTSCMCSVHHLLVLLYQTLHLLSLCNHSVHSRLVHAHHTMQLLSMMQLHRGEQLLDWRQLRCLLPVHLLEKCVHPALSLIGTQDSPDAVPHLQLYVWSFVAMQIASGWMAYCCMYCSLTCCQHEVLL